MFLSMNEIGGPIDMQNGTRGSCTPQLSGEEIRTEHVVGVFPKATMTKSTDPKKLSRDERIQELARILAHGIIRLVDAASTGQASSRIRAQTSQSEP